ncbi:galectin-8-like isoform X3 [Sander vitreus]
MSATAPRQTFLKPVIPFAGTILGGLLPGEMVLIQGSVPSDADRFQVDFTCGSSVKPRADVAFHFNPRFKRSACVVCNSLQRERWGREEILYAKPFAVGDKFELVVLVLKDTFKVAVNGAHLLEYKQRVELERVDTVSISGKVHVEAVGILPSTVEVLSTVSVTNQEQPQMSQKLLQTPVISSTGDLSIPFRGQLDEGLTAGRSITIKGVANHNAQSADDVECNVSQCGCEPESVWQQRHRSSSQPSPEEEALRQKLLHLRLLGPRGDPAGLLPLHGGGVL